jgi:hypothetical protein
MRKADENHETIPAASPRVPSLPSKPEQSVMTPNKTPNAKAKQEAADEPGATVAAPKANNDNSEVREFKRFADYRWADDALEIKVIWDDNSSTWEPEEALHRDAEDALLAYWKKHGGRPTHPEDADLYQVFAILDHKANRRRVQVQWLGFSRDDTTWEPVDTVKEAAPTVLEDYWNKVDANKGSRGRPPKTEREPEGKKLNKVQGKARVQKKDYTARKKKPTRRGK